jgi:transposase-like protein
MVPDLEGIFGTDLLREGLRGKLRELVSEMLEVEVDSALTAARYARTEVRAGYRNGTKPRTIHTAMGSTPIEVPRARLFRAGGGTTEWQSKILPQYERRTSSLDETLVGMYLSGTNLRRIKQALKPLLAKAPLDKNVISRLVGRLKDHLEEWRTRSLAGQTYLYLYLDATNFRVKLLSKVRTLPVLVVMGVRQDGQKEVLAMVQLLKESEAMWSEVLEDLKARGLRRPILVILDGHGGLRKAVGLAWPGIQVQRCTVHKLRNIQQHSPKDVYPQVKADYDAIINAETLDAAKSARSRFLARWKGLVSVVRSLEEAGDELLTFYGFPKEQWKSLKTTNPIERINLEFKRRVKTQCSLPNEPALMLLLFGLLVSKQLRFRKIDGWEKLVDVAVQHGGSLAKAAG